MGPSPCRAMSDSVPDASAALRGRRDAPGCNEGDTQTQPNWSTLAPDCVNPARLPEVCVRWATTDRRNVD